MSSPSLLLQILGRAPARRFVHAQRARKLRKAGIPVHFFGISPSGRAVYMWTKRPVIIDYTGQPVPWPAREWKL